jgi:hypothetical protein
MPPKSALITESITVAPLPQAAGAVGVPQSFDVQADATQEFISGGQFPWYAPMVQTLPPFNSDVEADFGPEIWDKILLDPHAYSGLMLLVISVFTSPITVVPASTSTDTDTENAQAEEMSAHCAAQIANLDEPIERTLSELLHHALAYGHGLAETVVEEPTRGDFAGQWRLKSLSPKPRANYRFVKNGMGRIIGVLPVQAGGAASLVISELSDEAFSKLLPLDKCPTLTFGKRYGDLRGQSHLRPAYKSWWLKNQAIPEWLKHVATFGSPFIDGMLGPNPAATGFGTDNVGNVPANGAKPLTPQDKMANAIRGLRNGGFIVRSNGSTLDVKWPQGAGEAFKVFIDWCKNETTQTILFQTLATQEGQHQARAASQTHMDILTMFIDWLKGLVCEMVQAAIFKPILRANYGDDAADKYTPSCTLGTTQPKDVQALMLSIAALQTSGYLEAAKSPTIDALDEELGLPSRPEPTPAEIATQTPTPDPLQPQTQPTQVPPKAADTTPVVQEVKAA